MRYCCKKELNEKLFIWTEWISYQDCTHEIPESLDRDGGLTVLLSTLVTVFAYWLIRFVQGRNLLFWSWVAYLALLAAVISALAFAILHAHRVVMRFTTLRETWRLGIAMALKVIILYPLIHVFYPQVSNERLILGALLDMMTTTVVLVSRASGVSEPV